MDIFRIILIFIVCCSALRAEVDSVFTKTDVYHGKVIYAMSYSLFLQNDTSLQIAIPTEKIERLVLGNGEEIIGPGIPNRRYYRYLDTFDVFPSGTPDSLRSNLPAPGTVSVMGKRLREQADYDGDKTSERSPDVEDVDGNTYRTIKIGAQTWMAENLRVTHYRDGTPIPLLTQKEEWTAAQSGAMALYDQKDTYGILYNWYAATDIRGLAPDGWHIPSDEEWSVMEQALGMENYEAQQSGTFRGDGVASKLSVGNANWEQGALTEDHRIANSEFSALPSGFRGYLNGSFSGWGNSAYFWSASAPHPGSAWYRSLSNKQSGVYRDHASKRAGLAIRCVKNPPGYEDNTYHAQSTEEDPQGYAGVDVNRSSNAALWRGMTTEMARQSLGEPERINRTEIEYTIHERWVYPDGKCLFFRSSILKSWEDEAF